MKNKQQHQIRRVFTPEFKEEAVRLVFTEGHPVSEVSRDLDVAQTLIYKWKEQMETRGNGAFPGRGKSPAQEKEIRLLKKKLAIAEEERDILKKAVRIFSVMPEEDTDS